MNDLFNIEEDINNNNEINTFEINLDSLVDSLNKEPKNKEDQNNVITKNDNIINIKSTNIKIDSNNFISNDLDKETIYKEINDNNKDNKEKKAIELIIKKDKTNINIQNKKENKEYAIEDTINVEEFDKVDSIIKYPFELDIFQKRSIIRLDRHENVLVCAHTSSGKTVVAEYAIAMGRKNKKRVFYTSPIKALSNQKYREFKEKFGDVGILTGDVSINADAQTVIMTTEILQSSLYKNSSLLNQCEWVIFDEVHYINDNERGHVWEEILILLPPSIGVVMLSATIPNYKDFANWVGRIKNNYVYMQVTNKRIVPLEHKIYLSNKNEDIIACKDVRDNVKLSEIERAISKLTKMNENNKTTKSGFSKNFNNKNNNYSKHNAFNSNSNKQKATYNKIIEISSYLVDQKMTPGVIFVFSLKKINEYSTELANCTKDKPYINNSDRNKILSFFDKCINSMLNEVDRKLPQINKVKDLLLNGIGVHHAGLLPILKEIVEILYSKGLIKVLFATTSFSIGLNMPTRSVVFTDITKYNDQKKEILSSSEYLQMCGRAGRRGLDDKGHVFILLGDKTNPPMANDIASMMKDGGNQVESKFRLSYKTLLSILSRDIKDINQFFKESYLENSKMSNMPEKLNKRIEIRDKLNLMDNFTCIALAKDNNEDTKLIRHYYNNYLDYVNNKSLLFVNQLVHPIITQEGRLIKIKSKFFNGGNLNKVHCFNNLLNNYNKNIDFSDKFNETTINSNTNKEEFIIVLAIRYYYPPLYNDREYGVFYARPISNFNYDINNDNILKDYFEQEAIYKICLTNSIGYYLQISPDSIDEILEQKIKLPKNIYKVEDGYTIFNKLEDAEKVAKELIYYNNPENYSLLKEINYQKEIKGDLDIFNLSKKKAISNLNLSESSCSKCIYKEKHFNYIKERIALEIEYQKVESDLNEENLKNSSEFEKRILILKKLRYISEDNTVEIKGKAARELSTSDCVLMTETLLGGVLDGLTIKEKIAFLSGFAVSKSEIEINDPNISGGNFSKAVNMFTTILNNLREVENKLSFEENKYNRRFTFSLSSSILSWMNGESFYEVQKESQLEEGKLFALIMRLFQLCDEIKNFFKILNLEENAKSFEEAKDIIVRDILSCRSLYIQDIDFNL